MTTKSLEECLKEYSKTFNEVSQQIKGAGDNATLNRAAYHLQESANHASKAAEALASIDKLFAYQQTLIGLGISSHQLATHKTDTPSTGD